MGEIDEGVQQLLRETYGQVIPSPEFKQRLYKQLTREVQARQQPVGWLERVRAPFARHVAARRSWWWQPAISVIVAVVLLVLVVAGVVWAMRGGLDSLFQLKKVPEERVPVTLRTPTVEPPVSSTSAAGQPDGIQPATLGATPAEPGQSAIIPSLTAPPTVATVVTRSPTETSTSVPTATHPATPTSVPTATTSPTEAATPASKGLTSSPTPTQAKVTNSVPSPTAVLCDLGRIVGAAWVDTNGNGVRDGGDSHLGGVTVTLENSAGHIVGTVITGADGQYEFDNLPADRYFLRTTSPAGYEAITAPAWGADLLCSTVKWDSEYRYQTEE